MYFNFGAIGTIIGHEMTHGFDLKGKKRDGKGRLTDWWDESTSKEFQRRADCFINQFNGFKVDQVGLYVNGHKTPDEVISDNGGIKAAYMAYANYAKKHPDQTLPGLDFT